MTDIFISYGRSTEAAADRVAEALRALGYEVWRDDQLPAHRGFAEVLDEKLKAAKAVVVIWSAEAARSDWVQSEADKARAGGKLVQLTVDGSALPMPFDRIQCADLVGWTGEADAPGWRKVVASVGELLGAAHTKSPVPVAPALALANKPSIAVLPFVNRSGDPDQEYFADGMVEEITRALSRSKAIFVIGSGSSLTFKGKGTTPQEAAATLGVRYALTGSVRKAAGRVRIAVELIDGADGKQIWADRFEDTLEDVFALQDRVALSVAGVIEPAVREADLRRVAARASDNLGSYDLYLRGFSLFRTLSRSGMLAALDVLHRAIALDPELGAALALTAFCHAFMVAGGLSEDPAGDLDQARALVPRALAVGADDAEVLAHLVLAVGILGEDRDMPTRLADRALELNPGSALAWTASGYARTSFGDPALGFEHLEAALRLDPLSPLRPNVLGLQGFARLAQGQFREAITLLNQSVQLRPELLINYVFLAACHGHLGERAQARDAIARFQARTPMDLRAFAEGYPDPAARKTVLAGIARAESGGPGDQADAADPP